MNLAGVKGVVFGKGPSFQQRPKADGEIHVCLNHAANEQPCDVLIMNDYEMSRWLKRSVVDGLQMVVIPYWPHVHGLPDKSHDWRRCLDEMAYYGEAYVYNLASSPPEHGYPTLRSYYTSAETAVEWLLVNGCRDIICYGVGTGVGYHPLFEANYHEPRWDSANEINTIGRNVLALAHSYGAAIKLN